MITSYNKTENYLTTSIEDLIKNIVTSCQYLKQHWQCEIKEYKVHEGYMRMVINTSSKELDFRVGGNQEYWIEFPQLNLTGSLSDLEDVFYNFQKLNELLNDPVDAFSISCVLHECQVTIPFLW